MSLILNTPLGASTGISMSTGTRHTVLLPAAIFKVSLLSEFENLVIVLQVPPQ